MTTSMKNLAASNAAGRSTKRASATTGPVALGATLLMLAAVLVGGCESAKEAVDNFDSRAACGDYCDKRAECANETPSDAQNDACVDGCRDSIEDNCGNEHQEAANDKIGECSDQGCAEFVACMTFSAAPECFGFVGQ